MAVGIQYGTNETGVEKRAQAYAKARELYREFEKKHGSVMCRDLLCYDLSDPSQAALAGQEKVFEKVCWNLIRSVVESYCSLE